MSYTTTTNKLKITELDFDGIKTALKTYLQGQDDFKDYDFDGSAMSILLDILAYNTHYNGFYTNMLASEMFMDSATLRSSVVSLAKHLGYTPASRKGAIVEVDLSFIGDGSPTNILIPKNAKFTTNIGKTKHTFLATESRTATLGTEGTYDVKNVQLKEGVLFTSTQTASGTSNEVFPIPNENVDIDSLSVYLAGELYTKADDYTEISTTDKVYFVQEGSHDQYEIYFGDGVVGKKPENGDLVQIEYSASVVGKAGNGAKKFVLAESLVGVSSVVVSLSSGHTRSSGGAEREDTSTIRIQAPRQYALQKRVVTANDYKARLKNDYNIVESVRVWGGEENTPPQYGKVFICIKPKTGYVLSQSERQRVAYNILKKRNMVGVTPEFVDPDYLFVVPDVTIAYDPRKTSKTADQLIAMVRVAMLNYSSTNLGKFDEYFRHSVLARKIDDVDVSILNNNMEIAIKKRIKPILRVAGAYKLFFDNPLYRPHEGHRNILTSTLFTYNGLQRCSLSDEDGVINIVQADFEGDAEDNQNGEVVVGNIGRINYETGEVIIDKFRPTTIADGSEYVHISVKPRIDDILPIGNTILTIENSDINVTAIDDTDRLPQFKTESY